LQLDSQGFENPIKTAKIGCLQVSMINNYIYNKRFSNLINPNLLKNITLITQALIFADVAIYGVLLVLVILFYQGWIFFMKIYDHYKLNELFLPRVKKEVSLTFAKGDRKRQPAILANLRDG